MISSRIFSIGKTRRIRWSQNVFRRLQKVSVGTEESGCGLGRNQEAGGVVWRFLRTGKPLSLQT